MALNELVVASVNRQHAKIRALGERAVATLKTWKIVTKLHCSLHHGTASSRQSCPPARPK
jgi:hypothetical protein